MGFLMSFGVVIEGMTVFAFLILILGNKTRREQGWAVLAILVTIAALVQIAAMSLTVGAPSPRRSGPANSTGISLR